ncbi:MAG: EAL domain-containing response regulator [Gammaproteobacteria bacterium]|nr:EAL domain-containing response regulator [Gammaproteobacteria bacterium]
MKIMLIDDEPFILNLLTRQIMDLGFNNIISFSRADEALKLIHTGVNSIGMIFCDLQMPEIDGIEVVRKLVQAKYKGGLVLVSGEDERVLHTAEKLARAHELRVLGSLKKPVLPEQIKRMLELNAGYTDCSNNKIRRVYAADEIYQAITNKELVNYYQPQMHLATGKITGVESLVRWQHPVDGLIFPDQFIGVAEEFGLIDGLSQQVLSMALADARIWQDEGYKLKLSINVSMDNLAVLDFPELIIKETVKAGFPQENLILEVTESKLMKDPLAVLDILTRLRLKHFGLSIDDFGTGHSSLAQLRDLPFDELKIDRGFVHGLSKDASLNAIFKASIAMAKKLGMKTVAEGVEDMDDLEVLQRSGCDLVQGYLIAKPMPSESLLAWLKNQHKFFGA